MSLDSLDPENILRELERLAEGAARSAKAKVDEVFMTEGYTKLSLAEQKAFMHGARIGSSAMLDAISAIVPKIVGLSEGESSPNDDKKGSGNPFSP